MACSGSHCTNHGTGTTTCSNHRSSCSTNRALSSNSIGITGARIDASELDQLRRYIRDELTRYNLHSSYNYSLRQSGSFTTSIAVTDDHVEQLRMMVVDANGGSYYSDRNGASIQESDWGSGIKTKYDAIRQNCICNTDCACNNVCSCHNNCDCNYSDERLKRDIEFIEERNGLNVYTFKYLWDDVKRTGVMAQEILKTQYSKAVRQDNKGYYMVDYSMLPKI